MRNRIFGTVLWICLSGILFATYLKHGEMIGGAKYFAHMGLAGAQLAQVALIGGALLLAGCALFQAHPATKFLGIAVGILGALFAANFIFPMGMNPYVYPFGSRGLLIPLSVSIIGFIASGSTPRPTPSDAP